MIFFNDNRVSEISSIHQPYAEFLHPAGSKLNLSTMSFHTDLFNTLIKHLLGLTGYKVFPKGHAGPYSCEQTM